MRNNHFTKGKKKISSFDGIQKILHETIQMNGRWLAAYE